MDILIIILFLICLWGIKFKRVNHEYLKRETTTAIKGIFAIIILFSHTRQYFAPPHQVVDLHTNSDSVDQYEVIYSTILSLLGQLMVVMFLLYSGYGIVESYKNKRHSYVKGFLRKRVLKTLVHFDLAVLLFLCVALVLGHDYSLGQYILSFTGFSSIGNSNWFVFDIIVLYLISYAGLIIVEKHNLNLANYIWIVFSFSLIFAFLLILFKGAYWWDTLFAFPMGMLWSVYKDQIELYLSSSKRYIYAIIFVLTLFCLSYLAQCKLSHAFALITAVLFGTLVLIITMRLHIGNTVLYWLGVNAFSIYILQRIPMIILSEYGLNYNHIIFALIVYPLVFLIAWGFTRLTNLIDSKFFN